MQEIGSHGCCRALGLDLDARWLGIGQAKGVENELRIEKSGVLRTVSPVTASPGTRRGGSRNGVF